MPLGCPPWEDAASRTRREGPPAAGVAAADDRRNALRRVGRASPRRRGRRPRARPRRERDRRGGRRRARAQRRPARHVQLRRRRADPRPARGKRRGLERRRPRHVGAGGHARSVQGAVRRTGSRGARERRRARSARRMADGARALGDVELRRGCGGGDRACRGGVRARPAGRVLDRAARPRLGHDARGLPSRRARAASPATCCASPTWPHSFAGWRPPAGSPRPASELYEGEVARRLVEFNRGGGGWLTVEDLAGFRAEVAPSISRRYGGWIVHTPDTWCQGPALLQALAILDGLDLPALGHNTAEYLHVVAEAVKLAFSDRERYYGDPRFVDVPLDRLLSDEHAAELRALIGEAALPNLPTLGAAGPALRHDLPVRRRPRRKRLQRDAERHARGGPDRAGARDRRLAARSPEQARPVASGRARPGQAPAADAVTGDRRPSGRARLGVRQPGWRRDPPGDAAGVPQRRRVRDDPAAGGRGAPRRELRASRTRSLRTASRRAC